MRSIAVIADSQRGGFERKIVSQLSRVDAAVFLGSAPRSFDASVEEQVEDLLYTMDIFSRLDCPVYWMPGNFETVEAYEHVFREHPFDNIIDAMRFPFTRLGGYDLKFFPGGCRPSRGYLVDWDCSGRRFEIDGVAYAGSDFSVLDFEDKLSTIVFAHQQPHFIWSGIATYDRNVVLDRKKYFGMEADSMLEKGGVAVQVEEQRLFLHSLLCFGCYGVRYYFSADEHDSSYVVDSNACNSSSRDLYASPGSAKFGCYGILDLKDDGVSFSLRSVH